jgi:hypothetical protein
MKLNLPGCGKVILVYPLANEGSGQEGLWFMAGNLALARCYSRFLALQIKAKEVGLVS